jgi:hypothetical protein
VKLIHTHPLAEFRKGPGPREFGGNGWFFASELTAALEGQGPEGKVSDLITALIAACGHPKASTRALILQTLAATGDSQAHLRVLQLRLADGVARFLDEEPGAPFELLEVLLEGGQSNG